MPKAAAKLAATPGTDSRPRRWMHPVTILAARSPAGAVRLIRTVGASLWLMIALGAIAQPAAAAPESQLADSTAADTAASASFAPTWQAPWNPPQTMPRRRGWERAVLMPGRLLSLPLAGLGNLTDRALGDFERRNWLATGPSMPRVHKRPLLSARLAHLGDRSGLGAAVVAQYELHGRLRSVLAAEYAATYKDYGRAQLSMTGRPLSLSYRSEWRPSERFYGVGTSTLASDISDYALHEENLQASARWESGRDPSSGHSRMIAEGWAGPRSVVTSHGRGKSDPDYGSRFPGLAAAIGDRTIDHLVAGAGLTLDQLRGAPHWTHGWRMRGSVESFTAPARLVALRSASDDGAKFSRLQLEGETGLSMRRDPRTLRIFVHVTDQQVASGGERFLISDLATLGGSKGLAGYEPGRFHDRDLLLTRLLYVFPIGYDLAMDLHSEWGAVYPDVWHDASLGSLHHSYGFALHTHDLRRPRGSFGFDFSPGSVRMNFTLGVVE